MGKIRQRRPGKLEAIAQGVRARIIAGDLALGTQLTYRQFQQEYQAGMATVQAAVKLLIDDGFLITRERFGTFVSLTPPYLSTYGVIFHSSALMTVPPDGTFQSVFAHVCQARQHTGIRLNLYFQVTHNPEAGDYPRLLADISSHRLTGLIFPGTFEIIDSLLAVDPALPIVSAIKYTGAQQIPGCSPDQYSFIDKALDYLAVKRRRKVAMLLTQSWQDFNEYLLAGLAARGMVMQPFWRFEVSAGHGADSLVSTATSLLLTTAGDRPDAMVIGDDILVDAVVKGIHDVGMHVGTDVELVAHCNYPLSRSDQVPIKRLGFSAPEILDHAIHLIDLKRSGQTAPEPVKVAALFDNELTTLSSTVST